MVVPKNCIPGFYCPNVTVTAFQFPCPVGTFSSLENAESDLACILCTQGYYCEAENITAPTAQCDAGELIALICVIFIAQ